MSFSNRADFIVQSHRGAGDLSTDNTLEAFELGWSMGTIPEADVRTTRDGVIVAFHDNHLARVVKEPGPGLANATVADVSWRRLSKLDVGSWKGAEFSGHRVPRLADVFKCMRGRPERQLYMDIKAADLRELASVVETYGTGPQVIFASTDYPVIEKWIALVPNGRTLLWMGMGGRPDESHVEERFAELRKIGFRGISQLQVHVHLKLPLAEIRRETRDPFLLRDEFLIQTAKELEERGILFQALPWEGASEAIYWKLLDLGVQSFATNRPDITLRALQGYEPPSAGKFSA